MRIFDRFRRRAPEPGLPARPPRTLAATAPELLPLFQRPQFWRDYFFQRPWEARRGTYPELDATLVILEVTPRDALVLGLDADIAEVTLYLQDPTTGARGQLGWDDEAEFHPHVFRWPELDSICRSIAAREPRLAHPGLPLLLLHRFAPLTPQDDAATIRHELTAAWQCLGIFDAAEVAELADLTTQLMGEGDLRWQPTANAWVLEGFDAYSARSPENAEFPHAQLARMVAAVQ